MKRITLVISKQRQTPEDYLLSRVDMNYQQTTHEQKIKITKWIKQNEPELAMLIREFDAELEEIERTPLTVTCH